MNISKKLIQFFIRQFQDCNINEGSVFIDKIDMNNEIWLIDFKYLERTEKDTRDYKTKQYEINIAKFLRENEFIKISIKGVKQW